MVAFAVPDFAENFRILLFARIDSDDILLGLGKARRFIDNRLHAADFFWSSIFRSEIADVFPVQQAIMHVFNFLKADLRVPRKDGVVLIGGWPADANLLLVVDELVLRQFVFVLVFCQQFNIINLIAFHPFMVHLFISYRIEGLLRLLEELL